ncbi:MAG: hypothetical protein HZB53_07810 [Chloroflexi bacterium]|nr:hypothetical protein [Chloroflexota bacterium]
MRGIDTKARVGSGDAAGQHVTVDGDTGIVTLIEDGATAADTARDPKGFARMTAKGRYASKPFGSARRERATGVQLNARTWQPKV